MARENRKDPMLISKRSKATAIYDRKRWNRIGIFCKIKIIRKSGKRLSAKKQKRISNVTGDWETFYLENVHDCNNGISSIYWKEFREQLWIHCKHNRSHTQTNVLHIYKIDVWTRWHLWIGEMVGKNIHGITCHWLVTKESSICNERKSTSFRIPYCVLVRFSKHLKTPQPNVAWEDRLWWVQFFFSKITETSDRIGDEPMEFGWNIFQGYNTLQLNEEVKILLLRLDETPQNFRGRIMIMLMFNDISRDQEINAKECLANTKLVSLFARRFGGQGQWLLLFWFWKEVVLYQCQLFSGHGGVILERQTSWSLTADRSFMVILLNQENTLAFYRWLSTPMHLFRNVKCGSVFVGRLGRGNTTSHLRALYITCSTFTSFVFCFLFLISRWSSLSWLSLGDVLEHFGHRSQQFFFRGLRSKNEYETGADATCALSFLLNTLVDCDPWEPSKTRLERKTNSTKSLLEGDHEVRPCVSAAGERAGNFSEILRRCLGWILATQWSMTSRSASPMKRVLASRDMSQKLYGAVSHAMAKVWTTCSITLSPTISQFRSGFCIARYISLTRKTLSKFKGMMIASRASLAWRCMPRDLNLNLMRPS